MFYLRKKGDANFYVIGIILTVISLAVLIVILTSISLTGNIDRQVCKDSVILRGTLPDNSAVAVKDLIPLRCKTKRVCVTANVIGNGDCESSFGDDFQNFRISGNSAEREDQIKSFLAQEMVECWDTLAEGKLKIFSKEFDLKDNIDSKGIFCTRIVFDKSVSEGDNGVEKINDLAGYLLTHRSSDLDVSYMDYLRNTPDGDSITNLFGPLGTHRGFFNTSNEKAILYLEYAKNGNDALFGSIAGSIIGFKFGLVGSVGGGLYGSSVGEKINSLTSELGEEDYISSLFLIDYSEKSVDNFDIDSFENIP